MMDSSKYDHNLHQQQEMVQWARNPMAMDRRWKANVEVAPNCPRCASTNTKFCYYNNYSLSQPRYFCKGCRRYWTKGGSLRNIPAGGGCRKSRRAKSPAAKMTASFLSSTSYSHSTSTSVDDDKSSSSNGVDIDLAAVFAKFLSNNTTTAKTNLNVGDDDDDDVDNYMEMQRPVDLTNQQDKQLQTEIQGSMEGFHEVIIGHGRQQEESIKQLISPAENVASAFDEVVQDVIWSNVSNLTACRQLPVAEFEDEFKNLTNQLLLGDDWSCFDLMPDEIFSRSAQF